MSDNQKGFILHEESNDLDVKLLTNHLLVIGINAYQNGIPPLNNAVSDARAFERLLTTKYAFDPKHVIPLYDKAATLGNIIQSFDRLSSTLGKTDNLIVYFSGHGELINNRGYWIPVDAQLHHRHTYLSNHQVRDFFSDLNTHHALGIIDACFSGSLMQVRSLKEEKTPRYYGIPSRWVMTSGQVEPVPDGLPGHHSPFAKSLLTQLEYNTSPYLNIQHLWVNMREGIISNSAQTPACEPLRNAGHQGGEYFFIQREAKEMPPASTPAAMSPASPVIDNGDTPDQTTNYQYMDLDQLKTRLRKHFIENELEKIFQILVDCLKENSPHKEVVYLRYSNYNSLRKDLALGIRQQADTEMAQIRQALDFVINKMTREDLKAPPAPAPDPDNKWLQNLENAGLKMQAELLIKKRDRIQKALILEDEPTRQLRFEEQLEELEQQLQAIKDQMSKT